MTNLPYGHREHGAVVALPLTIFAMPCRASGPVDTALRDVHDATLPPLEIPYASISVMPGDLDVVKVVALYTQHRIIPIMRTTPEVGIMMAITMVKVPNLMVK